MKLLTTRPSLTPLLTLALPSVALTLALTLWSSRDAPAPSAAQSPREVAAESYGRIPLGFEANRGQTDASFDFLARGAGYSLFLNPTEAVFALRVDEGDAERNPRSKVLRMRLEGADASALAEGADELEGKANYLIGDDPSRWRTGVPTFGRVHYRGVYPGVDLVYYGNQRQLEYDFRVAAGADPRLVSLRFEGADKVEVNADGDLLLALGGGVVRQPRPVIYQEAAGERRAVEGGYEVGEGGRVRFRLGEYDAALPLVIDPVIVYSTYLGGSGQDSALGVAVDSSGQAYLAGFTTSTNFPVANAFQAASTGTQDEIGGTEDAFVTKLNAAGTALVYSTYLGGSAQDQAHGIAVDSAGNAYVHGFTVSTNFPVANALQAASTGTRDAFVTKLNAAGNALVYSTYLGGDGMAEFGEAIAVDAAGSAYLTGNTSSTSFPTANAIQATFAGSGDVYVTKLNPAGSALVYSTYLGGSDFDSGTGIAVDSAGNAYVTGVTFSTNFPTADALQVSRAGGTITSDAFITKINAAGSALVYSTYLGGSDFDRAESVAVDSAGNAYVTGGTSSTNFPTANALQPAMVASSIVQAFVTKINAAGSALVYSTYLGGHSLEGGYGIAVDSAGNAYVAGETTSTSTFPTANALQCTRRGGGDGFITKINAAGTALAYSTYLGGSGPGSAERIRGIAVDSAGNAYVAGSTNSTDFPTVNPIQSTFASGCCPPVGDAFIAKVSDATTGPASLLQFTQTAPSVQEDMTTLTLTVQRTGDTSGPVTVDYATADGSASERKDYTTAVGTLHFAAGETAKTFEVLVNEDSFAEGNETFTVALSNPTDGATLSCLTAVATVQITDDATEPAANPIDDSAIFVGQHYHDFLNRQADPPGLAHWTNVADNCGDPDPLVCRINVSAAFFLSIEFQQTGYLVERTYKAAYGDATGTSTLGGTPHQLLVPIVRFKEFLPDTQRIGQGVVVLAPGWEAQLEANKVAFFREFVQRPRFLADYPLSLSPTDFVDRLNGRARGPLDAAERLALIDELTNNNTTEGRASVLRKVAEHARLEAAERNRAFVLMQYFGYLRRNPNDAPDADYTGYDFWLGNLERAGGNFVQAELVKAFISSTEYRQRFGQ